MVTMVRSKHPVTIVDYNHQPLDFVNFYVSVDVSTNVDRPCMLQFLLLKLIGLAQTFGL